MEGARRSAAEELKAGGMNTTMSKADREELKALARQRSRVAKTGVDQMAAERLADVEEQLSAQHDSRAPAWAEVTARAKAACRQADEDPRSPPRGLEGRLLLILLLAGRLGETPAWDILPGVAVAELRTGARAALVRTRFEVPLASLGVCRPCAYRLAGIRRPRVAFVSARWLSRTPFEVRNVIAARNAATVVGVCPVCGAVFVLQGTSGGATVLNMAFTDVCPAVGPVDQ